MPSIVEKIRAAGASVRLISDGDVAGVIATSDPATGIDLYIGQGGAPEGVLAAAALRCVGGQIQTRLVFRNEEERARAAQAGHHRSQPQIQFDGSGIRRRRLFGDRRDGRLDAARRAPRRRASSSTESVVMRSATGTVRWIRARHRIADGS